MMARGPVLTAISACVLLASATASQVQPEAINDALALDDECTGSDDTVGAVELLQMRGARKHAEDQASVAERVVCPIDPRSQIRWAKDTKYCLSTDGNRAGNGVKLQLWECDASWSSPGQIFDQTFLGGVQGDGWDGTMSMAGTEYCVVVDGNTWKDGAKIQLWKCDAYNSNMKWDMWSNMGGSCSGMISPKETNLKFCIVIDGNRAFNGAKVQLWECEDGDTWEKTWSPMPRYRN